MTKKEMHIKALSKGIDSQTIKGSMTVVLLGHAVDMMMELQDAHEAKLKAKDEEIKKLKQFIENSKKGIQEYDELVNRTTDELWNTIKAKDERIIELEIIVQKMKSCENCSSFREVCFDDNYCNLTADEEKECQKNNYSNWQLKDKK